MDGYISKPVNQDRLFLILWRLLRSRKDLPELTVSKNRVGFSNLISKDKEIEDVRPFEKRFELAGPLPKKLPGLDINKALGALKIDDAMYVRIVTGFHSDNRNTKKMLEQALAHNDWKRLLQLAHGLKGSAANIGATELHRSAKTLEKALREKALSVVEQPDGKRLIDQVTSTLDRVLQSIQHLTKRNALPSIVLPLKQKGPPIGKIVDRLKQVLSRADPEQIMAILPAFKQQAGQSGFIAPSDLKTLEDQIAVYDYDLAQETLDKITSTIQEDS